ncbi:hypothetical protein KO528_14315 [Saccharophagus degradans]|uniref:BPSS1780 family membrane protein n=1 Tax=Saccharophagus degradans TaxID=86304 RepID=UPI001C081F73|nr:BPSS1780 family membrane protein [Saccharophagus degradans]MBU2986533.1 hypothetical protein [Saccharophagus degradans]
MSEELNPYSAPEAEVVDAATLGDFVAHEPRMVPVGSAFNWVGAAFEYFGRSAGGWVLFMLVGGILYFVLNMVPVVNYINMLFSYVWVGGIWVALKKTHDGEQVEVSDLFEGFKRNFGSLVLLSVIAFALTIVVFTPFIYFAMAGMGSFESFDPSAVKFGPSLAFMVIGFIVISMTVFFAPALIILNNINVISAMRMSFLGCLKNILPLIIYGIMASIFFAVGGILLFVGLLVAIPVISCMTLAAYKQIFID